MAKIVELLPRTPPVLDYEPSCKYLCFYAKTRSQQLRMRWDCEYSEYSFYSLRFPVNSAIVLT